MTKSEEPTSSMEKLESETRELEEEIKSEKIEHGRETCEKIIQKISDVFVGERSLLEKVLSASLANGHVLFEDYPGLGKTLLAKTFGKAMGFEYNRIQFTPDLLPADILGTNVWKGEGSFELVRGPIFGNLILADEVNRAPPKTQSALLEAMEENQVTIEHETYELDPPFFVIATQNPIEQEGTYPLPEAQMDRFLLRLSTGYPGSSDEEIEVHRRRMEWKKDDPTKDIDPVVSPEEFRELQKLVEDGIYIDESIMGYITKIVRKTRKRDEIEVGVSTRGGLVLFKLSRALALIRGRDFVIPDDVKFFIKDALSHRMILDVEYALEGIKKRDLVEEILEEVRVPREYKPG